LSFLTGSEAIPLLIKKPLGRKGGLNKTFRNRKNEFLKKYG
jgi:hypothetical protein